MVRSHEGSAHGAIDATTFLCSTYLDGKADELEVRLINFGCSTLCDARERRRRSQGLGLDAHRARMYVDVRGERTDPEATSAAALFVFLSTFTSWISNAFARIARRKPIGWTRVISYPTTGASTGNSCASSGKWRVLVDGYGCTANAGDLADRAEYLRELLERY